MNILQHAGIVGWPSEDLKLLWSIGGEVKFGQFSCLLMLQSFDNAWRLVNRQPLVLIVKKHLFHRFNQQMIVTVPAVALEEAKKHAKIP